MMDWLGDDAALDAAVRANTVKVDMPLTPALSPQAGRGGLNSAAVPLFCRIIPLLGRVAELDRKPLI
jgi:hypothetical protein